MIRNPRTVGFAVLRGTIGVIFFIFGVAKLRGGVPQFAAGMHEQFSKTWLPASVAGAFGYVMPFLEVGVGALLVVGLMTRLALVITGVLMLLLTLGLAIQGNPNVAQNLIYALVVYVLLRHVEDDGYGLDRLR